MMGFGWIIVLLAVTLVVLSILFPLGRQVPTSQPMADALLELAERRYARGEISKDEFESIKRGIA